MIEILELLDAVGRGALAVAEGVGTLLDIAESLTSSKSDAEKKPDLPVGGAAPSDDDEAPAASDPRQGSGVLPSGE